MNDLPGGAGSPAPPGFFCVTSIIGPTAKEVVQHDWPAGMAVMNPAARLIPVEA